MNMQAERRGRAYFVEVEGRLTLDRLADLDSRLNELIDAGARTFVLHMVNVSDFSSSGIARLLKLQQTVSAQGGALALFEPSPVVEYVLELSRLRDLFRIYHDEADVLLDFAGREEALRMGLAAVEPDQAPTSADDSVPVGTPSIDGSVSRTEALGPGANHEVALGEPEIFDPLDTRF